MLELAKDFWGFMRARRKYWLLPLVLSFLLLGGLLFFSNSAVAPFIYTLF